MTERTCMAVFIVVQFLTATACFAQSDRLGLEKPLALFFETRYEQALPLFERIAVKNRKNAEAQTWLAETYRRLGRKDEAITRARIDQKRRGEFQRPIAVTTTEQRTRRRSGSASQGSMRTTSPVSGPA